MKFDFNATDSKVYADTQKQVDTIMKAAEKFNDGYTSVREEMFKSLSQNGIMVFFKIRMSEGQIRNDPGTIAYDNGSAEFAAYREALLKSVASLGAYWVCKEETHNDMKKITQYAREFLSNNAVSMPVGRFIPSTKVATWRAKLNGTDNEAMVDSWIHYRKGTPKYLEYKERYSMGVKEAYRQRVEKYLDEFEAECVVARSRRIDTLVTSYLKEFPGKKREDLTESELALVVVEADKHMAKHPLGSLTREQRSERYGIVYQEFPVPSLNFEPSGEMQINTAKAEDIKKAQEDCGKIKEMMITETIASLYLQMKKPLDKLKAKTDKGAEVDKKDEEYLEELLQAITDMKLTIGGNPQLDEMEATLLGVTSTDTSSFSSFFDEGKAKKLINAGGLKSAIEKYSQEVESIVETAGASKFASTMKALKF